MKIYAGIGSRRTPSNVLNLMHYIAILLAKDGYSCNTGACTGADQAFANGALAGGGPLNLFLPWTTYEQQWRQNLQGTITTTTINEHLHPKAFESVKLYHPTGATLKQSLIKLHGRNYLIIDGVDFIICWTPEGKIDGGTGQALRIAAALGIKVYNLGLTEVYNNFLQAVERRKAELI